MTGLVGPKCPFLCDKIVVPSTALLYPAYKNNNQTRGSLGRVCVPEMYRFIGLEHLEFPKFLLIGKRPRSPNLWFSGFVGFRDSGFWVEKAIVY